MKRCWVCREDFETAEEYREHLDFEHDGRKPRADERCQHGYSVYDCGRYPCSL